MSIDATSGYYRLSASDSGEALLGDGKKSWLTALARALGRGLGTQAARMVGLARDMSRAAGDTSAAGAQRFSALSSEFQAQSQLFSINSNAISTALKAIGDGSTAIARKG